MMLGGIGNGCSSSILMAWRPWARPWCDNDEGDRRSFQRGRRGYSELNCPANCESSHRSESSKDTLSPETWRYPKQKRPMIERTPTRWSLISITSVYRNTDSRRSFLDEQWQTKSRIRFRTPVSELPAQNSARYLFSESRHR